MSDAHASTPRLNSSTRIAHSPGSINHQPPCCRARPSSIIRKPEEVRIRPKGSRAQPGTLTGVGPQLCANFVELRHREVRRTPQSGSWGTAPRGTISLPSDQEEEEAK